jgi:hypothetical protein
MGGRPALAAAIAVVTPRLGSSARAARRSGGTLLLMTVLALATLIRPSFAEDYFDLINPYDELGDHIFCLTDADRQELGRLYGEAE